MTGSALWYADRGTGIASLGLLTAVLVLGVLTRGGRGLPGLPRFAVAALHRSTALLLVAFVAVHVLTAVLDGYVPIGWTDAVLPFASPYRPVWTGLGAVALDLLVALAATGLLRERIGQRAFRAVHWAAYAMWPAALVHALGNGTDVLTAPLVTAAVAVFVLAAVAAVGWRVLADLGRRRPSVDPGRTPDRTRELEAVR